MNKAPHKLKVGLDYHGVINDNPTYFKQFCAELLKREHEVHILSGGPKEKIVWQLQKEGICYNYVFTIFDYYNAQGLMCQLPDGDWHVDEDLWNKTKAEYCRSNKIDVQIDDSLIYGQYFTTPYCLYSHQKKQCLLFPNNQVIDLAKTPPLITVNQLESIFC